MKLDTTQLIFYILGFLAFLYLALPHIVESYESYARPWDTAEDKITVKTVDDGLEHMTNRDVDVKQTHFKQSPDMWELFEAASEPAKATLVLPSEPKKILPGVPTPSKPVPIGPSNKKEVEQLGIHIGAVATYEEGYDELAHGFIIGRAFDNRVGGFMIAEVARLLKENKKKLPYSLYIVNAVQEEIGLRGAEMIARRIKPDVAIITDVTHDSTTPMINKIIEGECKCGKGPSLCYGPAVHNKLLDFVQEVGNKTKIPFQLRAISRSTGTDTDSFAYANDGCPSVLISIPLRYMHTTVEMIHKDDVENTVKLMYESLLALTPKTNLSYFK